MNSSHYPILELCKKLTEAGFPRTTMFTQQSSSFMENWYLVMNTKIRDEIFNPKCFENWSTTADMKKEIVYPSVMELLDEMPKEIIEGWMFEFLLTLSPQISPEFVEWNFTVQYLSSVIPLCDINISWTLPNALAEMWLWLKENKYLYSKNSERK